jgi:hypothetical protein
MAQKQKGVADAMIEVHFSFSSPNNTQYAVSLKVYPRNLALSRRHFPDTHSSG